MSQPTMEDTRQSLEAAAATGNIAGLYTSIKEAPAILDHIDAIPFVDTPLHIAASAVQPHFAAEILNLKPSFGRKLNLDGFSPLHLALLTLKDKKKVNPDWQNNEELKFQIGKLRKNVKQLVKFEGELVRVRGREMFTPLHLVAQEDDEVDLLSEFLRACPASIEDVTVRDETALHIAVKNSRITTFQVLLGWLRENRNYRSVLNRGDEEGNTVLHIAASKPQPQIVELLVKELNVEERKIKNDKNLTTPDIVKELGHRNEAAKTQIMKSLNSNVLTTSVFRAITKTELSMDMRNIILVVAVLIATATYQAVLSPPGGGILENKNFPTDHIINGTINLLPGNNNITTPSNATIFLTTTSANTTTNPLKRVLHKTPDGLGFTVGKYFFCFYILNTVTFVSSIVVMMVVLPWHLITSVLHVTLICLTLSYGATFYTLVPSYWFATALMISSSTVVASVYFVRFNLIMRRQIHAEINRN